jgi:hypothetical protein
MCLCHHCVTVILHSFLPTSIITAAVGAFVGRHVWGHDGWHLLLILAPFTHQLATTL